MLNFLTRGPNEHLKRAEVLLREAHLARIEHQAAAEHHAALADMYAERAARLEREVYGSRPIPWLEGKEEPLPTLRDGKVHSYPFGKTERIERR